MRLTLYTDYALRVLIHLGLHDDRLCSISEVSRAYDASHNHLMKVVRGRSGGMRLARPADRITVGDVVRHTEEGFLLADCSGCTLSPACGLTGVLAEGMAAMLEVFDRYTIADLLQDKATMRRLVARQSPLGIGAM
jgi:Rrf2 family nitric oxide-sensitive transcriptional repressor